IKKRASIISASKSTTLTTSSGGCAKPGCTRRSTPRRTRTPIIASKTQTAIGSIWPSICAGRSDSAKGGAGHDEENSMKLMRLILLGCLFASIVIPLHAQEGSDPKVVQAARREGEIVWYTTMSSDQSNAFMARFQQKYPFLKPSIIRLGGSALLSRIVTESKAGKNFFDVAHGTGEIVLPLMDMGLLAPYVSPERKMIPDDLKDKKGFWTSVYVNSVVLGFNTNLTRGQPV